MKSFPTPTGVGRRLAAWLSSLGRRGRRWALAALLGFVVLVALADFATGDRVPLLILYLPAIAGCCWLVSLPFAIALSLVCSTLWLVDDVLLDDSIIPPHHYWLAAVHLVFFVIIASILSRLRVAYERERRYARTDMLTGLYNGQAFMEASAREAARSRRAGTPLAVAFVDCDNFKTVNDELGHLAGDDVLRTIGDVAREQVREADLVARLGGDEFAILLPDVTREDAERVIHRVRDHLNRAMQARGWPVTFSIGVAIYAHPPESSDDLIRGADDLMYSVKRAEKNAVAFRLVA